MDGTDNGLDDALDRDLDAMEHDALLAHAHAMRAAIREHRDAVGHDLCWHHPDLWSLLPDRSQVEITVPPWPQFLRGCVAYRQSLDTQLPDAPRVAPEYEAAAGEREP